MAENHVLVVDDDLSLRELLLILLEREGYEVTTVGSGEEAMEVLESGPVDLVLSDLNMPGMDGFELVRRLKQVSLRSSREIPVVLITAYGTAETAVEAMKQGVADYVLKPFNNDELLITIRRTLGHRALKEENLQLRRELKRKYWFGNLVGASPAMFEVYHLVQRVKDARVNCLLQGESGTGKEMVARAIHYSGSRRSGPFVAVNCGAIPESLFESELFGYRKGAFTGALSDRSGTFVAAGQGTLFLDEVGDLPLSAQVKVLRALAERKVRPVGGVEELPIDVRVIAASNKDLEAEVSAGRFREDLFYRLNVVRIDLPPLRERTGDLPLLAREFVEEFAREQEKPVRGISPEAMELLEAHDWPGNVRELRNAIERAVALEPHEWIGPASLPPNLRKTGTELPEERVAEIPLGGIDLDSLLERTERRYLRLALDQAGGNKTRAAGLLGMSFRSFRYRLAKLGMDD